MGIRVIVLDFDNTLSAHSEEGKQGCFAEAFAVDGSAAVEAARAYVASHPGVPRKEMINGICRFAAASGVALTHEPSWYLEDFGRVAEEMAISEPEMPGAAELLRSFSEHLPIYVISATPHESLQRIIEARGWASFVTGLYGTPPGTKRGWLEKVVAEGGYGSHEVLVAGDGASDRDMAEGIAQFVGMRGLTFRAGVRYPFPVVSDCYELARFIGGLP